MIDIIVISAFVLIILAVLSVLIVAIKDGTHILYLYYVERKIYRKTTHKKIFWTDKDFELMQKAHDCRVKRIFIASHYLN